MSNIQPLIPKSAPAPERTGLNPLTGATIPDDWQAVLRMVLWPNDPGVPHAVGMEAEHIALLAKLLDHCATNRQATACIEAGRRLSLSTWLARSPLDITEADMRMVREERPWDLTPAEQAAWLACMGKARA